MYTVSLENRDQLSRAIMHVLKSWPELQRRVFVEAHYEGRPIESISRSTGLSQPEVRRILENCDRKLHWALRSFRSDGNGSVALEVRASFCSSGCFR